MKNESFLVLAGLAVDIAGPEAAFAWDGTGEEVTLLADLLAWDGKGRED